MTKVVKTVKAFRLSDKHIKKNRIPGYGELCDGATNISPIKIRNLPSYSYHIAENVKGELFLIEDGTVLTEKLYYRNIGFSEADFMLDSTTAAKIKKRALQETPPIVKLTEEVIEEATIAFLDRDNETIQLNTVEDTEGETNE